MLTCTTLTFLVYICINLTSFLLDPLKISCVTGLVIACNMIITTLIYYLFLFTRSCIYLIVVCV